MWKTTEHLFWMTACFKVQLFWEGWTTPEPSCGLQWRFDRTRWNTRIWHFVVVFCPKVPNYFIYSRAIYRAPMEDWAYQVNYQDMTLSSHFFAKKCQNILKTYDRRTATKSAKSNILCVKPIHFLKSVVALFVGLSLFRYLVCVWVIKWGYGL